MSMYFAEDRELDTFGQYRYAADEIGPARPTPTAELPVPTDIINEYAGQIKARGEKSGILRNIATNETVQIKIEEHGGWTIVKPKKDWILE